MHKRSSRSKKKRAGKALDVNQIAAQVVEISTGQPHGVKNPAAVALGRLGGKKGGRVRAERLSAERRQQIASAAARARWGRGREP